MVFGSTEERENAIFGERKFFTASYIADVFRSNESFAKNARSSIKQANNILGFDGWKQEVVEETVETHVLGSQRFTLASAKVRVTLKSGAQRIGYGYFEAIWNIEIGVPVEVTRFKKSLKAKRSAVEEATWDALKSFSGMRESQIIEYNKNLRT